MDTHDAERCQLCTETEIAHAGRDQIVTWEDLTLGEHRPGLRCRWIEGVARAWHFFGLWVYDTDGEERQL